MRAFGMCAALVLAAGTLAPSVATVHEVSLTVPGSGPDLSPATCNIKFVDNPHPAASVPGAIKVNARAECSRPVEEHSLAVTLIGDDSRVLRQTVHKETNASANENKDTWIMCKNHTEMHTFQGAAMGTSWEGGRPYIQVRLGNKVRLPCGY